MGALSVTLTEYHETQLGAIESSTKEVLQAVKDLPKAIADELEKRPPKLGNEVSEMVANKIVGESYFKWDSVTSYSSTVTCIFTEAEKVKYLRRAQLKGRLPTASADIIPQIINELKTRAREYSHFAFDHGNIRVNYVAPDKRFKITVYVKEKLQAISVLEMLCAILGEEIHPVNIYYTDGLRRGSITRRTTPIGGTPAQQQDYRTDFKVKLTRVVLHVNGLERPEVL